MKTIKLLFVSAVVGISSFVFSGNASAFFIDLVNAVLIPFFLATF